jgi:hypothetical protein
LAPDETQRPDAPNETLRLMERRKRFAAAHYLPPPPAGATRLLINPLDGP